MVRVFRPYWSSEGDKEPFGLNLPQNSSRNDKCACCDGNIAVAQQYFFYIWLTYLFGNHLKLIVTSAHQNNIQASTRQLEEYMHTNRVGGIQDSARLF